MNLLCSHFEDEVLDLMEVLMSSADAPMIPSGSATNKWVNLLLVERMSIFLLYRYRRNQCDYPT